MRVTGEGVRRLYRRGQPTTGRESPDSESRHSGRRLEGLEKGHKGSVETPTIDVVH